MREDLLDRRTLIIAGAALSIAPWLPRQAFAQAPMAASKLFAEARAGLANGREIRAGRVQIEMPRLAENGNSVQIKVVVESPMTAADHVKTIHLLSEQNPIATIGRFHLGPRSGRGTVETYIRLATTQNVHAIAEMSDGNLWSGQAEAVVLLAACLDGG